MKNNYYDVVYDGLGFKNIFVHNLSNPDICEVYDIINDNLLGETDEQVLTPRDFEMDENDFETWEDYMDDFIERNDLWF